MIRLVGGLPGSGKSYFAANFIAKYGTYDKLYQTFIIEKDIKLFTNLDDLQIQHDSLDECFQKYGGPAKFFTVANFTKIRDMWPKAHILVIIDEAQRIIDDELLKDKDVAFFFQYHRHLGIDIFLLTNDISSCSKKVVGLCEFLVMAQPRSKGLPGVFRYKFTDTKGTFLYSQSIRLRQEVFSIYKSFTTDETEKPKNVVVHWIVTGLIVLTLTVVGFKVFVNGFMHKKKPVVSATGKMVEKPVQGVYSAARAVPPVSAPLVPVASASKPYTVRRRQAVVPASALPSPPPLAPLVVAAANPGWFNASVSGTIQVGDSVWYSVDGSLVPSSECKRYNERLSTALCRVPSLGPD